MQPNEITEVLNRPASRELLDRDLTRLGYVAQDGTPRSRSWSGSGPHGSRLEHAELFTA